MVGQAVTRFTFIEDFGRFGKQYTVLCNGELIGDVYASDWVARDGITIHKRWFAIPLSGRGVPQAFLTRKDAATAMLQEDAADAAESE